MRTVVVQIDVPLFNNKMLDKFLLVKWTLHLPVIDHIDQ